MSYPLGSPPARIIAAGRKLFFERGFERVSTDALAREAKVSKASLYKYFPNMSEVLKGVVRAEGDSFEDSVPVKCETFEELRDALILYGVGALNFLNKPEIIQFCQLMMEEARAHPQIALRFYESAYQRSFESLKTMFEYGQSKGYLKADLYAGELAEMLMGMWEGIQWNKARMGLTVLPFPDPDSWATKCVDLLLNDLKLR